MDVPTLIVKGFLEENFSVVRENNSEFMICSPFTHDSEFKCYFSKQNGRWIDFKDGGIRRGDFVKFIALFNNITCNEAKDIILERLYKLGLNEKAVKHLSSPHIFYNDQHNRKKIAWTLPVGRVSASKHPVSMGYLSSRGITSQTADMFSLDYLPLIGYLVIPFYRNGKAVYYTQRNVCSKGIRWKNPINKDGYYSKADLFFGEQTIRQNTRTVMLVEGSFDAMIVTQWGFPVLAINGSSISNQQINALKQFGFKEIILGFDFDSAGINATYVVADAIKNKMGVKVLYNHSPEFLRSVSAIGKDWGELNKNIFNEYIIGLSWHTKLSKISYELIQNKGIKKHDEKEKEQPQTQRDRIYSA